MTKARMQGPANCSGFSHDGNTYEADENDIIEVPSHIVEHAKAHGFSLIAEKGPKKPEPLAKGAKESAVSDVSEKLPDETVKPAQKGARTVKGGAE